ncbi:MAG: exo-beta-N-acetylmuramidase NamZ domain-containing protein [Flavobacteriales bacterium]
MSRFICLIPLLTSVFLLTCSSERGKEKGADPENLEEASLDSSEKAIRVAAERMEAYLPKLKGKRIAVVANPSSRVGDVHLVDTLLERGVEIERIMSPEHGFRGEAEAGEKVEGGTDPRTGLPVVSLYGSHRKPDAADMKGLDLILFDIQDVGARFYTYISTLHYVMEAAAEHGKKVMLLDRPNPTGYYVDGPVLDTAFSSFIGMHPVPIVHGMTVGEYARMIDGEGWLKGDLQCELEVIECAHYEHDDRYELPVDPSPNLAQMAAIYLYPSLALFEGTVVSVGRGTERPFTMIGHPEFQNGDHRFVPESIPGMSSDPKHEGDTCVGFDLKEVGRRRMKKKGGLCLSWLIRMHKALADKTEFFHADRFDRLAGTDSLRLKIQKGMNEEAIRKTWKKELGAFKKMRENYLLYP